MSASNNQHPLSPARRHFVGASAAFVAKVVGVAVLASIAAPPSSQAAPGNGGGWGQGIGGGRGHCFLKGTRVLTSPGEVPMRILELAISSKQCAARICR